MTWQLGLAMICIIIGMPVMCGLVSWEAGRYEHRQHRRNMDAREAVVEVRERQVLERELKLGRWAHDFHRMTQTRQASIENDTTLLSMAVWEEPA